MKKLLMLVSALAALSLLAPSSSYAVGENGYMGLYFEIGNGPTGTGGSCVNGVAFLAHQTAYIVYLNPTLGATQGFECGIDVTVPGKNAQLNTNVTVSYPTAFTDVGVSNQAAGTYNYITGYSTPILIDGASSFVFATLDIFLLDAGQLNFTLRAASPASHGSLTPVILDDAFAEFGVDVTQEGASPTMIINPTSGDCTGVTLPAEDISWGAVKSLFR